jgi:hypothetical protein
LLSADFSHKRFRLFLIKTQIIFGRGGFTRGEFAWDGFARGRFARGGFARGEFARVEFAKGKFVRGGFARGGFYLFQFAYLFDFECCLLIVVFFSLILSFLE